MDVFSQSVVAIQNARRILATVQGGDQVNNNNDKWPSNEYIVWILETQHWRLYLLKPQRWIKDLIVLYN